MRSASSFWGAASRPVPSARRGLGRAPCRRRGLALVEVLLCLALASAAMVPFLATFSSTSKSSKDLEGRLRARALAEASARALEAMPYRDLLTLRADAPDGPQRRAALLPGCEGLTEGVLARQVEVEDLGSPEGRSLVQRVTITVQWRWPGADPRGDARRVVEVERVVYNRGSSLEFDGTVQS